MKVQFQQWLCRLSKAHYENGRTAIILKDDVTGGLIARATINFPDEPMDEDEVAIKDYSENRGMLDALFKAGVIYMPHRYIDSGFIKDIPICRIKPGVLPG